MSPLVADGVPLDVGTGCPIIVRAQSSAPIAKTANKTSGPSQRLLSFCIGKS